MTGSCSPTSAVNGREPGYIPERQSDSPTTPARRRPNTIELLRSWRYMDCSQSWKACSGSISPLVRILFGLIVWSATAILSHAQISFTSAIDLALRNSPRVKVAQDDVNKAVATLAETKDVFIPSITASLGAGASSGITLNVPTIFTVSAQSLAFNYSQHDYIRAARLGVQASSMALTEVRQQVEEDLAITYLSLDLGEQREAAVTDQYGYALKLVSVVQDRLAAGMESDLELKKARRTAVQIRLQQLQLDDQIA